MPLSRSLTYAAGRLAVLLALLLLSGCSLTRSTEDLEGIWEASWTSSRLVDIDPEVDFLTLRVGGDGSAEATGRYRYVSELEDTTIQQVELLLMVGSDGRLSGAGWWSLETVPYGRRTRETVSIDGGLDADSYTGELVVSFQTGLADVRLSFDLFRTH